MKITLSPSCTTFTAEADESVLQAARREKILLPYGCSNGACGTCKAKVLEGRVDHAASPIETLSQEARDSGWALMCLAKPLSDLVVAAEALQMLPGQTLQRIPALVNSIEKPAEDVMVLTLKLSPRQPFVFRPGQYVDILLKDNQRRSFSIANAPADDHRLEFHIRHIEGGYFTGRLFDELKVRDVLRIEGPLGTFHLRPSKKTALLVGGGTGFAPLKAIFEQAMRDNDPRAIYLYWGAIEASGLYMHELAQSWMKAHPQLTYVPMLSGVGNGWAGRRGLITQGVLEDFASLADVQVYACGSSAMINAGRELFIRDRQLPQEEFFSDAFTFASRTP